MYSRANESCCVLLSAVDKMSSKTESQVGAQHMCFVVCYVTFRAAYSVAVTFTVLLLLIRHFNRYTRYINNNNSNTQRTGCPSRYRFPVYSSHGYSLLSLCCPKFYAWAVPHIIFCRPAFQPSAIELFESLLHSAAERHIGAVTDYFYEA